MCGDPLAPSVLIVLRVQPPKPTFLRAVSPLVRSLGDWTWSRGQLRCLRAILLEVPPLSTVIENSSLFTSFPLGIFLRLFKNGSDNHYKGVPLSFSAFLSFPHIPYLNRMSEPVVTDYLKTDLVHKPILIAYGGYLEPTE